MSVERVPSVEALTAAIAEIEELATGDSAGQLGAAQALGILGDVVDAGPGCTAEDVARALLGVPMTLQAMEGDETAIRYGIGTVRGQVPLPRDEDGWTYSDDWPRRPDVTAADGQRFRLREHVGWVAIEDES